MAAISAVAPNFTLREFELASNRALTEIEREHAIWHAIQLQAARDAVNRIWLPPEIGGDWRIHITSYVRAEATKDHSTGAAVDWNVRDADGNRNDALTKWARDWLAQNRANEFAELIYEPAFEGQTAAHTHHARRGFSKDTSANERPQILDEVSPGEFVAATIASIPEPLRPIAFGVAIVGALFLIEGIARSA